MNETAKSKKSSRDKDDDSVFAKKPSSKVLDHPFECKNFSSDKVKSAKKPHSKVSGHVSSVNKSCDAADSSSANTTAIGKSSCKHSSLSVEPKKLTNADSISVPVQKSKVKTHVSSHGKQHDAKNTPIKTADKDALFSVSMGKCKKSSSLDMTVQWKQEAQSTAKKCVSSFGKVYSDEGLTNIKIPKISHSEKTAGLPLNQPDKCKNLSFNSRRIEPVGSKSDGGLRQQSHTYHASSFSGSLNQPRPSENTTKMLTPKAKKSKSRTKSSRQTDSDQSKHKSHERWLPDPRLSVHCRQNYSDTCLLYTSDAADE